MKTNKNRKIKKRNIPKGKLVMDVKNRTFIKYLSWLLVGIFFFLLDLKIIAIAFIAIFVIVVIFIKDEIVLQIYDRFLIIPEELDDNQVTLIYYNDIINWSLESRHSLRLLTNDFVEYKVHVYQTKDLIKVLDELLIDKKV